MDSNQTVTTNRHVRLYLGLGIGVLLAAAAGLVYLFTGPGS